MTETAEELAAEHTRRELEEMAEKLSIGTIGIGTKVHLAAAIIKAKEEVSAKEIPKPKVEVKAPTAEVKAQVKPAIGRKGVFAKREENEKAAAKIGIGVKALNKSIEEKTDVLHKGVEEIQKSFEVQVKANEKAVARIGSGIEQQKKANEKAAAKMSIGVKALNKSIEEKTDVLQKGVEEIQKSFNAQMRENEKAVARIGSGVTELQNEMGNYIQDFYYG